MILESLEFMVGDSQDAKLWRLGRPTDSFDKKIRSKARIAKEIKRRLSKEIDKFKIVRLKNQQVITSTNKFPKSKDNNYDFYRSKFGLRERGLETEFMSLDSMERVIKSRNSIDNQNKLNFSNDSHSNNRYGIFQGVKRVKSRNLPSLNKPVIRTQEVERDKVILRKKKSPRKNIDDSSSQISQEKNAFETLIMESPILSKKFQDGSTNLLKKYGEINDFDYILNDVKDVYKYISNKNAKNSSVDDQKDSDFFITSEPRVENKSNLEIFKLDDKIMPMHQPVHKKRKKEFDMVSKAIDLESDSSLSSEDQDQVKPIDSPTESEIIRKMEKEISL